MWTASGAAARELRKRRLRRALATAVLASGAGLGLLPAAPARAATSGDAAQFLSLINGLRAGRGVAPLAWNSQLAAVAQAWSGHQAATGTLAHNPNLAAQAPRGWKSLGENVGEGGSVAVLQAAFTASAPHDANMVNPGFSSIGIGVVQSGATLWVTEDFLGAGSTAAPPPPAPAPRPAPAPVPAFPPRAPLPVSPTPPAVAPPAAAPAIPPPAPVDPSIALVLQRLQGLDQANELEPDSPVR